LILIDALYIPLYTVYPPYYHPTSSFIMFKLLRRISSSIYPRPDRPWSDDGKSLLFVVFCGILYNIIPTATSNAPTIGRKRRISDEDGDDDDVRDAGSSRKRRAPLEREGTSDLGELRVKGTETDPAVKEVTRGVKEVELEDKKEGSATDDGKGTVEEASTTPEDEGESNIAPSHDPAQGDYRPSTVPNDDDEAPIVPTETEAIAEVPANDSPDVRTPEEPLAQVEDEKESTDTAPDAGDDEVTRAAEVVDPTFELDTTTSSPEANKQPEQ
jgi:hypothetical protein